MSNEKKNGSPVNQQNPLTSYISQVNSHLTAIAALTGASAGFLKDMAQKLVKVEAESARLRELLRQYGECEICRNNSCEVQYEDCTGECPDCLHTDCPCNGCKEFSKFEVE